MTINHLSLSFIIIPAVLCSQQVKLLRIVLTQLGVKLISRLDEALESFNFISQSSICSSAVVWDSIIVKSNNSIFLRELHYKCVMILKVLNILLLVYEMGSHAGKNQQQCPWAKKTKNIWENMFVRQFQRRHFGTHLFLICTVQVPPLLDWLGKVKGVHGDFDLANDVMFGEAIKVVHRHHQGLAPHFLEWNLEGRKQCFPLTPQSGMIWQLARHAVEAGQELHTLRPSPGAHNCLP